MRNGKRVRTTQVECKHRRSDITGIVEVMANAIASIQTFKKK
jgi:hypothetical protein